MRKSYRIKSEREFQKVFEHQDSVANRYFVIFKMKNSKNKHFRVGISVGKKVGHTAVLRNQIKRYIRQSLLELKPSIVEYDFLVIARKGAKDLDMKTTKSNLVHALKLAKVLDN